jgi:peroxiredoxin Q/BCP
MANLRPGDPMPETSLVGPEGRVELRQQLGKPLVVYFYPKDETYGCTKQACEFRDQYQDFIAAGAGVIGISRDDATSHRKFREHHRLPFTLLSDPDGEVAANWGVRTPFGLPGRVTFVFDRAGVLRHRFASALRFGKHVDEALAIVKSLQ